MSLSRCRRTTANAEKKKKKFDMFRGLAKRIVEAIQIGPLSVAYVPAPRGRFGSSTQTLPVLFWARRNTLCISYFRLVRVQFFLRLLRRCASQPVVCQRGSAPLCALNRPPLLQPEPLYAAMFPPCDTARWLHSAKGTGNRETARSSEAPEKPGREVRGRAAMARQGTALPEAHSPGGDL